MSTTLHPSALPILALIPLIVSLPVESPQPHLSHLFSSLLNQIYFPPTILPRDWIDWLILLESKEAGVDEKCQVLLNQVEGTCSSLLGRGTDAIVDWVQHDIEPLCSSEDDEPTDISQAPILRTSPLGIFIRKTCLKFEQMGFEELAHWCEGTREWFKGTSSGSSRRHVEKSSFPPPPPLSNPKALLLTSLTHFHHGNYDLLLLSLEECFKISRSFGEKATLRGCWSLLKRIPNQYRLKFLNQVGAGVGSHGTDQSNGGGGKGKNKALVQDEDLSNPHDILFEVYQSLLSLEDDPLPISTLFSRLYVAQILAISCSTTTTTASDSKDNKSNKSSSSKAAASKYRIDLNTFETELRFVQSEIWDRLGITPISRIYQDLVLAEDEALSLVSPSSTSSESSTTADLRLRILLTRARRLLTQDSDSSTIQALKLLLTSIETDRKRARIGLKSSRRGGPSTSKNGSINGYSEWKRQVLKMLESVSSEGHPVHEDSLATLSLTAPTSSNPSASHQSASSRLASNLTNHSTSTISQTIEIALSRIEMTQCTSREEAQRSLEQLERIENLVLIFSSDSTSSLAASSAAVMDAGMEDDEEAVEEEEMTKSKGEEGTGWGEMKQGKMIEAKYWMSLAKLRIIANDFDDSTIKENFPLLEKSLSIYESLSSTSTEIEQVLNLLESLSIHLSLSPTLSVGEAGEWRRRSERYKAQQRTKRDRAEAEEVEWKKVVEIADLVRELL